MDLVAGRSVEQTQLGANPEHDCLVLLRGDLAKDLVHLLEGLEPRFRQEEVCSWSEGHLAVIGGVGLWLALRAVGNIGRQSRGKRSARST